VQLLDIPDQVGTNIRSSVYDLFANAGVTLPSPQAIAVLIYETSAGTTSSRVGGPDVATNRGAPITAGNDVAKLPAFSDSAGRAGLYDLHQIFLWLATGDTIGITILIP
jgi:hypothetical protein